MFRKELVPSKWITEMIIYITNNTNGLGQDCSNSIANVLELLSIALSHRYNDIQKKSNEN